MKQIFAWLFAAIFFAAGCAQSPDLAEPVRGGGYENADGLVIGAGRFWLEPLMTPEHFTSFVNGSVMVHNFVAFPFIAAAVIMMVKWAARQMPESCDLKWFACLGGYINTGKPRM